MKSHPDCANGCQYAKDAGVWPEHSCSGVCQYAIRSDGPPEVALSDDKEELALDSLIALALHPRSEELTKLVHQKMDEMAALNAQRKCPHCFGDLTRYEDPLAKKMLAESENKSRAIKIGVGDVIHDRIAWTDTIPEALDVEIGFVNGGPDNMRCVDIGGERYIHANDLAKLLKIE